MNPIKISNVSKNCHDENSEYGGIYIGITNTNRIPFCDRKYSYDPGEGKSQEFHLQTQNVENKRITDNTSSSEENIIVIVHEPGLSDISTPITKNLSRAPKTSFDSPLIGGSAVLPNQVFDDEEMIANATQEHKQSCTPREELDDKTKSTNSMATLPITVSQQDRETLEHQRSPINDNEINVVEVVDELSSVDNVEGHHSHKTLPNHLDKDSDISSKNTQCLDTNESYKRSKEHKSILHASIANMIILLFVVVLVILVGAFKPINVILGVNDLRFGIVIGAIFKFYRTFSTIFTTIYCFEVVNVLFYQTALNIRDDIYNFYNVISCVF